MKKLLAIILSVICAFSCLTVTANAGVVGEVATDFFERLFDLEVEEDTVLGYGVFYEMETLSGVTVIYKPSPSISFNNPGTYTITSDTPLSIDYQFICWKDSENNMYYPGDKLYVDGQITLYAVWTEKNDSDVRVARIIKTTVEALRRLIGKFLGILDIVVEFDENYVPTEPDAPRYYDLTLNNIYYENETEGSERILVYIDSYSLYQNGMDRIDLTGNETCSLYLCTGWDEVTGEPLNKTDYTCSYTFAELQAANNSDVVVIDAKTIDTDAYTAQAGLSEGTTYYMIFTVNETLYTSPANANKIYPEYTNPLSCVFTLTA